MAGINDYSNTAGSNTTINGIDIAEGCSPAGINNAIRQLMADIADVDDGVVPLQTPDINGGTIDGAIIGGTTPAAGTFTTLTANTSITGTLNTAAQTNITSVGTLSALTVSGDLTVDTNTLYVDSTNNEVGIGTSSPDAQLHIVGTDTIDQIIFESTDSGTSSSPDLVLYKNSSSPDNNDVLPRIDFRGNNSVGGAVDYVTIYAQILDKANGIEDGVLHFLIEKEGSGRKVLTLASNEAVINDDSQDVNFRVESNNNANMLFVDGGNDRVGIGTNSPQRTLHIVGPDGSAGVTEGNSNTALYLDNNDSCILNIQSGTGSTDYGAVFFSDAEAQNQGAVKYNHPNNQLEFNTGGQRKAYIGTDKFVINEDSENVDFRVESNGNTHMLFVDGGSNEVGIGTGSPAKPFHVYGSGSEIARFEATGGSSFIGLKDSDDGTIGYIGVDGGAIKFQTSGGGYSDKLVIDTSGNIGISTSSPTEKLEVNGTVKATAFEGDGSALTGVGGGKVLQVVSATKTDTASTTSTTYGDITGLSVSITPSSTSSKIYVVFSVAAGNSNGAGYYRLVRNSTALALGDAASNRTRATIASEAGAGNRMEGLGSNYLDSPSTTSATTYKVQWRVQNSGTNIYLNRSSTDSDNESHPRGSSTITVMEIGA